MVSPSAAISAPAAPAAKHGCAHPCLPARRLLAGLVRVRTGFGLGFGLAFRFGLGFWFQLGFWLWLWLWFRLGFWFWFWFWFGLRLGFRLGLGVIGMNRASLHDDIGHRADAPNAFQRFDQPGYIFNFTLGIEFQPTRTLVGTRIIETMRENREPCAGH